MSSESLSINLVYAYRPCVVPSRRVFVTPLVSSLIAAFGAFLQEWLHWYDLRNHISDRRYKKLFASQGYWLLTGGTILSAGLVCWIWFFGDFTHLPPRHFLLFGFTFPMIIQKAVRRVESATSHRDLRSPEDQDKASLLRDYFLA